MGTRYAVVSFDPTEPNNVDRFDQLPGRGSLKTTSEDKESAECLAKFYKSNLGRANVKVVTVEYNKAEKEQPVTVF